MIRVLIAYQKMEERETMLTRTSAMIPRMTADTSE